MTIWKKAAAALFVAAIAGVPEGALAGPNGAGHYWGLDAGNATGSDGSATMHYTDAALAADVNLARAHLLLGTNISVYAIGTQNIVSVTGNNNSVTADQTGSNTGNISNTGSVSGQ